MTESKRQKSGFVARLARWAINRTDFFYRQLRFFWPTPIFAWGGKTTAVVTRFDDVQEVLHELTTFRVPYAEKIKVMMGGGNVFLGKDDDPERADEKSLFYEIMPKEEAIDRAKPEVEALADEVVEAAGGRLDIAMQLTQDVTTRFFGRYFGLPGPDDTSTETYSDWARLLFEFQFVDRGNDPALRQRVDAVAATMRDYVDGAIAARKTAMGEHDDLLERCLQFQAAGRPLTDEQIRNNLIAFIVGGFPQPPMIIPQLFDVLLDRPVQLAIARGAAKDGDDERVANYVFEALRFFPLTPGLFRTCARPYTIAKGTRREKVIPEGATVFALTRSAMYDDRVLDRPAAFRVDRPWQHYMHFGWGPHLCFGVFVNRQMTPAICKAVLKRSNLRRARGDDGRLVHNGAFAKSLVVEYD